MKEDARVMSPPAVGRPEGSDRLERNAPSVCAAPTQSAISLAADIAEVETFLTWLGGPARLVVIHPDLPKGARGQLRSTTFERIPEDNQTRNCYWHVNVPVASLSGPKAKKEEIGVVRFLHLDVDVRKSPDINPAEDLTRIERWLREQWPQGLPKWSGLWRTGGGFGILWRLAEPVDVAGKPNLVAAIEARMKAIIALFPDGDPACANVDRIMRLPGTVNWPDERKRKRGRVPAMASIVDLNDSVHRLEDFPASKVAAVPPPTATIAKVAARSEPVATSQGVDVAALAVPDRVKVILLQGVHPDEPKPKDNSRSVWVFDAVCNMIRAGTSDDVILSVLLDPKLGISESILELGPRAEKYARKQIASGHRVAAQSSGEFQLNENGVLLKNQHNIKVALAKLGVRLSYDEFADRMLANDELLDDAELVRLRLLIDAQFKLLVAKDFFVDVISNEARSNGFHPVCDYLDELTWDGKARIDTWLVRNAGAADTPYVRAVSAIWLLAAVRRVRQPGCKFDEMIVLESEQGKNKSSALALMAVRPDWFTDDLPLNRDSKEVIERTSGRWIVEAAELKGMRRGDVEHLKAFLSRQVDKARLAYGRLTSEVPRQFVLAGTTNNQNYLKDQTGNRRFWPVAVAPFDLAALAAERDQLWAEAAHREAQGESIRLDEGLWEAAAAEQARRKSEDPWVSLIEGWLGDLEGRLLAQDAWLLVGVAPGQRTDAMGERLRDALAELGFQRPKDGKLRFGGFDTPQRGFWRGDKNDRHRIRVEVDAFGRVDRVSREAPKQWGGARVAEQEELF